MPSTSAGVRKSESWMPPVSCVICSDWRRSASYCSGVRPTWLSIARATVALNLPSTWNALSRSYAARTSSSLTR